MLSGWNHFLRPSVWAYVLAVLLIAFLASAAPFSAVLTAAAISIFCMLCAASITVNHCFDAETDRRSSQLHRFPVASGRIPKRTAASVSIILMAAPAAIGFFLPFQSLLLVLASIFMIITYSAPPVRIKERPFIETIWNGLGYGTVPFYLSLSIFSVPASPELHLLGIVVFLAAASGHILLQVRDIEDDSRAGITTTSTRLGRKSMVTVSRWMTAAAGAIIIYLAAVSFLNILAWASLAVGVFIFTEHRKAGNIEESYGRLRLLYITGGLLFIASLLSFV